MPQPPAIALLGLLAAAPAHAATVWLCGLSDDLTYLVCVADLADPNAPPPAPVIRLGRNQYPLDPRLQWTVDMYGPATEPESMLTLAVTTLCYRSPDCEVIVDTGLLNRGLLVPAVRRSASR